MTNIQVGDTVELLRGDVAFHPVEKRYLRAGECVVVSSVNKIGISYRIEQLKIDYIVQFDYVKPVTPNQVEVKFR
jgi:hypothetical protein